ncbi:MAG TPA: DUF1648 domain-containing protein [Candidatus Sulfotelmatobacter sp.]|jgi:hypothetical protein|nr:DUF1648 domain-containing protein [Candidatus Sulfotelmatobacter sp.]
MDRAWYKPAIWLMWIALPLTALNYWRAWDQLPLRMAVHFDANWHPNGYTSREGSLMLALGITAFLLVVFTVAAHAVRVNRPSAALPILIMLYISLGLCWFANNWIVQRNLPANDQPPHAVLMRAKLPHISNYVSTDANVVETHL